MLVPKHETEYASVGIVAEVVERVRLPGRRRGRLWPVSTGRRSARPTRSQRRTAGRGRGAPGRDAARASKTASSSASTARSSTRSSSCAATTGASRAFVRPFTEPGALADTAGYSPGPRPSSRRSSCSKHVDVVERLEARAAAPARPAGRAAGAQAHPRRRRVRRAEAAARVLPAPADGRDPQGARRGRGLGGRRVPAEDRRRRHAGRRSRSRPSASWTRSSGWAIRTPKSSMIRTYLDWLLAVPWAKRSEERLDPVHAREVLDADHAGLDDVKERITEYLAVRKLRTERGIAEDRRSGVILTLIGPPGTGKTSIGESIARATGREFVRMSLGGVRDEAEIRGHRRTYIGALPGRLVRALRDAGTMNPVIMLDEVDKVGADWRGDPSAALLEVLDPAQNHAFRDHYLDVELDLSQVLFHRDRERRRHDSRPAARPDGGDPVRRLHDRREGRDRARLPLAAPGRAERPASGRSRDRRRRAAARRDRLHARGRRPSAGARARRSCCARRRRGIAAGEATRRSRSTTLPCATRSAGRRFYHETAERTAVPGVATGLAVTGVGGDVLFVEATSMPGNGGARPHRPARRRDEGVGAHRADLRAAPRGRARHRRALRRPRVPRPRARRRDPEGRAERRHHDDDGARVAAHRAAR